MSDKELLELAAKAAGIYDECEWFECKEEDGSLVWCLVQGSREWNPLTDDGDALRLAVKLRIDVSFYTTTASVVAEHDWESCVDEKYENDPYAATRRAIVRAAAEIGRGME